MWNVDSSAEAPQKPTLPTREARVLVLKSYSQFSKFHVCFCGLDPGNLKFETVWTHKQHICF